MTANDFEALGDTVQELEHRASRGRRRGALVIGIIFLVVVALTALSVVQVGLVNNARLVAEAEAAARGVALRRTQIAVAARDSIFDVLRIDYVSSTSMAEVLRDELEELERARESALRERFLADARRSSTSDSGGPN